MSNHHDDNHRFRKIALGVITLVLFYHAKSATASVLLEFTSCSTFLECVAHFWGMDEKAQIGLIFFFVSGVAAWIAGIGCAWQWLHAHLHTPGKSGRSHNLAARHQTNVRRSRATIVTRPPRRTLWERMKRALKEFMDTGVL